MTTRRAVLIAKGTATFRNCTVAENEATVGLGGGLFDEQGVAVVHNSILSGNTAVRGGEQIYNGAGSSTTVTYSDVEGGWTGTGNINSDPDFVNPDGGDFNIAECSPCWNAGSNSLLPAINMSNRKVGGLPAVVDMGADEGPPGCSS